MVTSDDGSDNVFNISEDLVQSPVHKAAGTSSLDFDGLLSTPLKLHEDLSGGCGGQLWPAGMVLSKYMLRNHRDNLQDRSMLAVALGCEVTRPLLITDQKPMLDLMKRNVTLNNLHGTVEAAILDWGDAISSRIPQHPDVILAADCVYFEPAFPLLHQTLQDLIGDNTTCYFCFKKRRRADLHFMKAVRKTFDVREVEDDPDRDVYARENIFL
ncbi:Protein-lysine N-methyltransferase efm6 [Cryomyces antarcticus]|uniref:Protein-lysine N-methyltransferase efm6 n=1 Tax=Cryomyces antarcticus TaxID=329879 RepID=A0ABR0KW10_9PEZI|nr:Protein-lysine N-methyltransferase efm6 [Cryomyces antarcticus]KAK5019632.1 Protein-lysine N-methyltransferase efm6 [Cryomyces antarcticus]KAK5131830.1 Protein-lysine N-methyltransferase efm6 [Cryomyces antarcticus]